MIYRNGTRERIRWVVRPSWLDSRMTAIHFIKHFQTMETKPVVELLPLKRRNAENWRRNYPSQKYTGNLSADNTTFYQQS